MVVMIDYARGALQNRPVFRPFCARETRVSCRRAVGADALGCSFCDKNLRANRRRPSSHRLRARRTHRGNPTLHPGHIIRARRRADAPRASPTAAAAPPPPAQPYLACIQPIGHAQRASGRPDWWGRGTFLPVSHLTFPARHQQSGGAVDAHARRGACRAVQITARA